MLMIKPFAVSLLMMALSNASANEGTSDIASDNIKIATTFMNTLLTDRTTANSLMHDGFEFYFMGISQMANERPYSKETYWTIWMDEIVGPRVPGGFTKVEITEAIGDENGVALLVEGDAKGINGRYNNSYVFVFRFEDGKIRHLREYTSDLMVETRLYKQKLKHQKGFCFCSSQLTKYGYLTFFREEKHPSFNY